MRNNLIYSLKVCFFMSLFCLAAVAWVIGGWYMAVELFNVVVIVFPDVVSKLFGLIFLVGWLMLGISSVEKIVD